MNNINKVIPLTMALTIFPSANAALSTYADKASFLAATSSVTTEDFSGEADGVFDSRSFKDFNAILVNKSFGNTGVNQPEIYNAPPEQNSNPLSQRRPSGASSAKT